MHERLCALMLMYHNFQPLHFCPPVLLSVVVSGCEDLASQFLSQEIDGQALLLLKEEHLMSTMNIKLGPALKICAHINSLRDWPVFFPQIRSLKVKPPRASTTSPRVRYGARESCRWMFEVQFISQTRQRLWDCRSGISSRFTSDYRTSCKNPSNVRFYFDEGTRSTKFCSKSM